MSQLICCYPKWQFIYFLHGSKKTNYICSTDAPRVSPHLSHPLVQSPFPYKAQQLVVDQVEVFLSGIDDCHNDIMTDGFLWVMGTHL